MNSYYKYLIHITGLIIKHTKINNNKLNIKSKCGASLVAQWLGIRLPMHRTRVQALVREDPTCHGATNPVRHNY